MNRCFKKTSHPKCPTDGQGWTETEINDTLNAFDSGETRTPTLIVQEVDMDEMYTGSGFGSYTEGVGTVRANGGDYGGGFRKPCRPGNLPGEDGNIV